MIRSKKEYFFYTEADRIISGRSSATFFSWIRNLFLPDYIWQFMVYLRKTEYLMNSKGVVNKGRLLFVKYKFRKISVKLGFSIPPNVFGPGLYIPHYGTIVINKNTKVGANCVLHTSTCIAGSEPKVLGNNVYLSTGTIISGKIKLADSVTIGANSLVNKSFLESNVLLGGSPAKVIKHRESWFKCDGRQFEERVIEIDKLHKKLFSDTTI